MVRDSKYKNPGVVPSWINGDVRPGHLTRRLSRRGPPPSNECPPSYKDEAGVSVLASVFHDTLKPYINRVTGDLHAKETGLLGTLSVFFNLPPVSSLKTLKINNDDAFEREEILNFPKRRELQSHPPGSPGLRSE